MLYRFSDVKYFKKYSEMREQREETRGRGTVVYWAWALFKIRRPSPISLAHKGWQGWSDKQRMSLLPHSWCEMTDLIYFIHISAVKQ